MPQSDNSSVRGLNGVLSFKAAVITPEEIIFFYVAQFPSESGAMFQARLPNTDLLRVDSLGKMGTYDVGVIRVPWIDKPGQEITLQVGLTGEDVAAQLTLLKQIGPNISKQRVDFLPLPSEPSTVKVELGQLGGDSNYSLLKLLRSDQSGDAAIFLRVDRDTVVSEVTALEYTALVPASAPTANQDPFMPTPAPVEKP